MASIRKKIFQIANSLACTNAYTKKKKEKNLYVSRTFT